MRILQEKALTFMPKEQKLNCMPKAIKIQSLNDILSFDKNDRRCKEICEFVINCDARDDDLKNVDNLINATKANHEEMEHNPKWAVCHASVILEPSKLPGSKTEGLDMLLDWNVTEHW